MQWMIDVIVKYDDWIRILDLVTIVISLIGIPAILWKLVWNARKYKIFIECLDGDKKGQTRHIETIRTPDLKRAEVLGVVTMRAGQERMDLPPFVMKDVIRGRTVTIPLKYRDFVKWGS